MGAQDERTLRTRVHRSEHRRRRLLRPRAQSRRSLLVPRDADELLAIARAYTQLLDRCRIPWEEVRTSTPGRIVYEDSVQVVAVPFTYAQDWQLPVGAQTRSD